MKSQTLHILTPVSNLTPEALLPQHTVHPGDLVTDLRGFPSRIYQIRIDHALVEITSEVVPETKNYWTVTRDWLLRFTDQTCLQDLLTIDGYGIWWTLDSLEFSPTLSDIGNLFSWIDHLIAIESKCQPSRIVMHGQHEAIIDLVAQILPEAKTLVLPETESQAKKDLTPRRRGLIMVRVLLGLLYLVYGSLRRPDICFFSGTGPLRYVEEGRKQKLHDVLLGDLAQILQGRGWRVTFVEKYGWNASWHRLLARGWFFPNDVLFLLSSPLLHRLGTTRRWHRKWQEAKPHVKPHLEYQGCDISPLIMPLLAREFTQRAPSLEVMTALWRRILDIWRPKLLYINHSYGSSAVPAIIAAKKLNIPSIEQQHGVIGKNHSAYLVPTQLKTASGYPLCDAMVLWGTYAQRLLVESGVYSKEQAIVCGSPRTDALLGSLPPRFETLDRLGIPHGAKVVLYASNALAHGFMTDIMDSIQSVAHKEQVYWIIKLHPRETTRDIWEQEIQRRDLQQLRVVWREYEFYTLLAACDVHVSFASTTLIEAAILGRPNLGLSHPNVPDPVGYGEAKAFLPVLPGEVGPVACAVLENPLQKEALLHEQSRFGEDWCLHDGKALERIVTLVETTIADNPEAAAKGDVLRDGAEH